jgi:tetratricopeptide (TPR) repeat protein
MRPPPLTVAQASDEATTLNHYRAGVGLIREKKYQQAVAELDQSLAQKPGYAIALIARGSAKIGLGLYDEAVVDYSAAQKADPALASPLFGLAEAYRGLGQAEKAASMYREFASSGAPDAQENLKQYALQNAQVLSPK